MPQAPGFAVFQRVTADLLNATTPTLIQKATSLPAVVSSTTLVNDSELAGIALGIGVWDVQFMIYATADTSTTLGDIKTAWTFSGTASGFRSCLGPAVGSVTQPTTTLMRTSIHGFGTSVTYGINATGTFSRIEERSMFTVTAAGNLNFQYAQDTSSTTATTVQAGSYMTYRQIG